MKKQLLYRLSLAIMVSASLFSCRKDPQPAPEQVEILEPTPSGPVKGLYLLNEGNMNMNKASLDYLDFSSGYYSRNIYNQANPEIVKGLGDVGNDIGVYGSKVYVVVNLSNKIEVLNAKTGKKIGQIPFTNCRYITFYKGKGYASAYLGTLGDPTAGNGVVIEIDTATLTEKRRVEVGRQPEELAVVRGKLFVANSGGYSATNYERTVSVIDLNSFQVTNKIDVAINLHRLKADKYGDLYVSSRGDYMNIPSKLFVIDTQTEKVKKSFDIGVSEIVIDDDLAYYYSTEYNYETGDNKITYGMIDVKTETPLSKSFITDGTNKEITIPYGIAVNPITKDVFVTDAKDYVSPGTLYCFNSAGIKKFQVTTGDIPAHFAFVY
ncbi:hypothetical protein AY601_2328 [Pedobacter cryoconitis]|uniref:YncE family protein n=1 Tax=Pedobacter cryoconitis TaxID=188932 RepID=A0A127VCY5_9SPHI|nr:YncE family protein [Pedobacter cryoconitis]AMP99222.1 hypothetical protein AY601_2328 [Pedobacter cryoconitis]